MSLSKKNEDQNRNFVMTSCVAMQRRFNPDDAMLIAARKLTVTVAGSRNVASCMGEVRIYSPGTPDADKGQAGR